MFQIKIPQNKKKKRRSNKYHSLTSRKEDKELVINEVENKSKKEKQIQVSPKKNLVSFPMFGKKLKPSKTESKIKEVSNLDTNPPQDETNKSENKISSTVSLIETPPVVTITKGPVSSSTEDNPETISYQPQCQHNYNYDQYQNPYYNHQYYPTYPYPYQFPYAQNYPYDIQAYYSYYYNLQASALASQNSIVGVTPIQILPTTPVATLPTTPVETVLSTVSNETKDVLAVPEVLPAGTELLPAPSATSGHSHCG